MNDYERLKKDFIEIGIKKGMVLVMHSSFKALDSKELSPKDVYRALQEILTNEGTLLIPTLSYKTATKENPFFDYYETPSCVGIISETFRFEKDTFRSLNPIHSICAWGKHAKYFTSDHELDSITLHMHSPFYKMLPYKPKILMMGCGLKPNTFMHLVENLNEIDYRRTVYYVEYTITNQFGVIKKKMIELPDMKDYIQRYDRVEQILSTPYLTRGMILHAQSYLLDAEELFHKASSVMKINPHYFVDKI